ARRGEAARTGGRILDRRGVDDADDDDVGRLRDLGRALSRRDAPSRSRLGLADVDVKADDAVPSFDEPLREALPHQAEANKSYRRHGVHLPISDRAVWLLG